MTQAEHIGGDELAIEKIFFNYGNVPIFQGLPIQVKAGEFLSVIGPSGCCKTTLLNLLSGFLKPDKGDVLLRG